MFAFEIRSMIRDDEEEREVRQRHQEQALVAQEQAVLREAPVAQRLVPPLPAVPDAGSVAVAGAGACHTLDRCS